MHARVVQHGKSLAPQVATLAGSSAVDVPIVELTRPTAAQGGAEEGGSEVWSASLSSGSSPGSDE